MTFMQCSARLIIGSDTGFGELEAKGFSHPLNSEKFDTRQVYLLGEISLEFVACREDGGPLLDCTGHVKEIPRACRYAAGVLGTEFVSVVEQVMKLFSTKAQAASFGSAQSIPGGAGIWGAELAQVVSDLQAQYRVPEKVGHVFSDPLGYWPGKLIIRMKPSH
jgi:hypothetical protein